MFLELKQGNSAKAIAEKISRVYGEGLITDRAVRNWFVKFRSGDMTKSQTEGGTSFRLLRQPFKGSIGVKFTLIDKICSAAAKSSRKTP
ncbi:hypothetical protein TNCT_620141 [Trichonephila clavata]|uniref:Mos1 transposase HTH domain-containing protein n=1 Tax=Trichonephila clavata TaxID=2740835 RepID=A0A8X6KJ89_TRICU|nr:hypothetical protein TNCT_620141 [Trichonephila clavata]